MKADSGQDVTVTRRLLRTISERMAPVWPLDRFVAVNPYQGRMTEPFFEAAVQLERVAGAGSTLSASDFRGLVARGELCLDELDAAIVESRSELTREGIVEMLAGDVLEKPPIMVATVADVAEMVTGHAWPRFAVDHLGGWCASFFDQSQAAWRPEDSSLFASWKEEAEVDPTPELMGALGWRDYVRSLPAAFDEAAHVALSALDLAVGSRELYLDRLVMSLGGWASHAARVGWDRRLHDDVEDEDTLVELLAVLLCFEAGLLTALGDERFNLAWSGACTATEELSRGKGYGGASEARVLLQQAYERSYQRRLFARLEASSHEPVRSTERPGVQAVFCIDVRSETFRRHLEAADAGIETMGFAGFFGMPIEHVPLGHRRGSRQCPVLIAPQYRVAEALPTQAETDAATARRRDRHLVGRAWRSFKMGAISCFSFVGPVGLAYLPKLFTDDFGLTRPVPKPATESLGVDGSRRTLRLEVETIDGELVGMTLESRVELATAALKAMSLTHDFARLVAFVGHESSSVNNPHASGLDCGACGGRSGEANARVAAAVLNDAAVRQRMASHGISIPAETLFVAAVHDTTTDDVTVLDQADVAASHLSDLERLLASLGTAGERSRRERTRRLSFDSPQDDWSRRARDWAQVRPEWGLAGCTTFVVAPRHRTKGIDLDGGAFLHSYVWKEDEDFSVLELIMTAPMVVASWISLQYYASTVDPDIFGAGNKVLHNVVGGSLGVLEGNSGDLRVGLPWQSVHDGDRRQHQPIRLNVVIEAPIEAMTAVINKHEALRELLDHGWVHLFSMGASGRVEHRYDGGLSWRRLDGQVDAQPAAAARVFSRAS